MSDAAPRLGSGAGARGTVIDDGAVRLEFLRTHADTDGAHHEMRATYRPGSPFPPAHLHPRQDECFEVREGALLFVIDGAHQRVAAGETIDVPRGSVHQARNDGDVPAVAIWRTSPARRTAEFFLAAAAARQRDDLEALLAVLEEFRDVFVLAEQPEA